jgi:Fe2+ transport system protein FeoA
MKANDLIDGQKAVITNVTSGKFQTRLIEMGCFVGSEITRLYQSPLGDPIAFDIGGYILGLRKEEADYIQVEASNGK